ncbi:MAG: 50S ribosomal protein L22 [Parcubacteria group bacterium]|nr:50S ribosomal protein L22 [Parcubacteria group bacterium]
MTQITAQLNYLRISPRKVRAIAGLLKGLDVDSAKAQLRYLTKRPARPFLKLLDSAVANARHNSGLEQDYLYIKEITVNEGMKLKRYKPKGFGMSMPIQKKTSHIKIVLDEMPEPERKKKEKMLAKAPKLEIKKEESKEEKGLKAEEKSVKEQKTKTRKETGKALKKGAFGGVRTLGRRLFRRKSI